MRKIKVLIIDDSAVIRNMITEVLSSDVSLEVVGVAEDPFVAREKIKQLNPDIITLDVEMPKMDGITFLENLMRLRPMPVVMLSTLTTRGADITLKAIALGAIDFIEKPSLDALTNPESNFSRNLINKIKSAVKVDQKNFALAKKLLKPSSKDEVVFEGCKRKNHLVAIGASTGGIEAIKHILYAMPINCPPIVIAQHIPKSFSLRFSQRLNEKINITVQEAQHGQKIKPGNAYVAPGDKHLTIVEKNGTLFCVLDDSVAVNRHKPAVDVLFNSIIPIADNTQAVLLTGMGQDGAKGMLALKMAGSRTIIQDKKSSLIWGMPGAAHGLNAHTQALPLDDIASDLLAYALLDKQQMKKRKLS